jgi:hypothetical protein
LIAAYRSGGSRVLSTQDLERVKGIEPSPKAWEAFVLPLNYTRALGSWALHIRALFLLASAKQSWSAEFLPRSMKILGEKMHFW